METTEQLTQEYLKWNQKYVKANEEMQKLQAPLIEAISDIKQLRQKEVWFKATQSLSEFKRIERDINEALNKLKEIQEKLSQGNQ